MSSREEGEVERRHVQTESGGSSSGAASSVLAVRPSATTVGSLFVSVLLFGGLALLFVGAAWGVLAAVGVPAAVAVAGLGMVAYAFVLAQILVRLGII